MSGNNDNPINNNVDEIDHSNEVNEAPAETKEKLSKHKQQAALKKSQTGRRIQRHQEQKATKKHNSQEQTNVKQSTDSVKPEEPKKLKSEPVKQSVDEFVKDFEQKNNIPHVEQEKKEETLAGKIKEAD